MEGEAKYGQLPPYYENLFRPQQENEHEVFMTRFWYWGVPAVLGGIAACLSNRYLMKPVFSGLQKHISSMILCGAGGAGFHRFSEYQSQERDAALRHYIMLHPEDFPEPERRKYRDVLETWLPIR
uniref:Putative mitochondrial electron transport nadh to ubiquinone n=1 Tax=Amblyomma tuberculatum TaxID=48802 RepID=A0A6M2E2G8_9ACAR